MLDPSSPPPGWGTRPTDWERAVRSFESARDFSDGAPVWVIEMRPDCVVRWALADSGAEADLFLIPTSPRLSPTRLAVNLSARNRQYRHAQGSKFTFSMQHMLAAVTALVGAFVGGDLAGPYGFAGGAAATGAGVMLALGSRNAHIDRHTCRLDLRGDSEFVSLLAAAEQVRDPSARRAALDALVLAHPGGEYAQVHAAVTAVLDAQATIEALTNAASPETLLPATTPHEEPLAVLANEARVLREVAADIRSDRNW